MSDLSGGTNIGAAGAGQSDTQRIVAAAWEDVLKKRSFGIDDDFFEVGGNSMMATLVTYRVSDEFGHEFPLMLIFENSTVAEMAAAIDKVITGGKGT
jgi:hypothetical protein